MKVLHLCLASFYIDNYSYQENLLPKYHKKMGLDVEIIASLFSFDKNGKGYYGAGRKEYTNEFGIPVTRLDYKDGWYNNKLRQYKGTYQAISKSNPDIIFIHGCQFLDIKEVVGYLKKHSNVKVFVDNHADFSNSATNWLSKNILHKVIWRYCANLIEPYAVRFYGVLPARVDFLKDIYKVPKEKVELLIMGADDEKVNEAKNINIRKEIREKYNIKSNDFLIVTGGKIDSAKKQTLLLMEAVKKNNKNVKLLVFGSVINELKEEVNKLSDGHKIQYIGWINSEDSYNYFAAADLVVFPGRHSVFWEQVVALETPLIVKKWKGTTHVDIGGNCKFLYEDSTEEIYKIISSLVNDENLYHKMKKSAKGEDHKKFLYSNIAEESIQ